MSNFTAKKSFANMSSVAVEQDRILAAIDIGTNSIHMVVVQIDPVLPAYTIIAREKDTVRLGERDPKTGSLTPEAMDRAIAALQRCQELAKSLNAEQIVAVATSAVREAPNGRAFLQRVDSELGLFVNLISGQEEARRIYLGVLSGMEFNNQPHIIIDIGGGSTELILGDSHAARSLNSTKIGAVRLTNEFITTDPIDENEFQYLQAYIRGMLERPVENILAHLEPKEEPCLVGSSGTIETLISVYAREKLGVAPNLLNGYQLSRKDLKAMVKRLASISCAERATIPGLSERRAEIIVAGAVILLEAMTLLGMESLTVSERALREGVIVDWMLAQGLIEDRLRFQGEVRKRSVLKVAQKYQVDVDSSDRIANFALSLFNQTKGYLHNWGAEERELLWAAAILHNCGIYVNHSAHHKHSYYLICNGELLGFTEAEIETIANLARYHRKSTPKKKHENYKNLPSKKHRQIVNQLSAILRLAVALDRRQIGAISQVRCHYYPEVKELYLHLIPTHPNDDCALELWSLDYKKGVFEEEYDVKLVAKLEPAVATVS
ncbi:MULTISPECIES: Ppx/GppA phosphatase family protein [unclassified Coleofasciculus]|uniref:Ppx/GppA phosphatase family protein n=1 Tax=unclassified Coleofasciculus TaxID=2692782 RepID=UPI00187FFE93|nr:MULTISPECIES: Ppx/GppA phosphatase family protein [unclassified Coleofasciculus]MBE9126356.1 Ppx/GppA family phosphatase [Coleofasciculus sp. LEGE 07081]MBE9150009.1 Ppx/GppA family phosphatase [Coleofasciculus sp. LEGE 07092]